MGNAGVRSPGAAVSQQSGSRRIWPWMLALIAATNLLAFSAGRSWGGGIGRGTRPDQLTPISSIRLSNLQQHPRPARGSTVCPSPLHSCPTLTRSPADPIAHCICHIQLSLLKMIRKKILSLDVCVSGAVNLGGKVREHHGQRSSTVLFSPCEIVQVSN
jgi:hypothetical protein